MARRSEQQPRALLERGLAALALPATLSEPLLAYLAELEKWNAAYNLTAVREPTAMVTRHLNLNHGPCVPDLGLRAHAT